MNEKSGNIKSDYYFLVLANQVNIYYKNYISCDTFNITSLTYKISNDDTFTGKSTFLKQMRIINEVRFDDDDIKEYQKTIYMNIIKGNKLDWIQVRNYYEKH